MQFRKPIALAATLALSTCLACASAPAKDPRPTGIVEYWIDDDEDMNEGQRNNVRSAANAWTHATHGRVMFAENPGRRGTTLRFLFEKDDQAMGRAVGLTWTRGVIGYFRKESEGLTNLVLLTPRCANDVACVAHEIGHFLGLPHRENIMGRYVGYMGGDSEDEIPQINVEDYCKAVHGCP